MSEEACPAAVPSAVNECDDGRSSRANGPPQSFDLLAHALNAQAESLAHLVFELHEQNALLRTITLQNVDILAALNEAPSSEDDELRDLLGRKVS